MERFCLISQDAKVAFFLLLSDELIDFLEDTEHYSKTKEYLNLYWKWFSGENVAEDDLYFCLENNNETGVANFMFSESDDSKIGVWSCLCDAFGYISLVAYQQACAQNVPQPLECGESEVIADFLVNFGKLHEISTLADNLLDYFVLRFPATGDNVVDIDFVRHYLKKLSVR